MSVVTQAGWYLDDARELADAAPYTFYLPSAEVLQMLQPGDSVKLVFRCDVENEHGYSAERMWVEITEIEGDEFRGRLDNEPLYIPDLAADDEISFSSYHIIDTQLDDPVPNIASQYWQRCFVTGRVLYDEQPVGCLYREDPAASDGAPEDFSGWNLIAGDEDDDYLDEPDNWHYVALGAVLNIDDRFIDLLEAPYDSEFEYDEDRQAFVEILEDEYD